MSKKNRYKFRDRPTLNTNTSSTPSVPAPAGSNRDNSIVAAHKDEYRIIRNDLVNLIVLNGLVFAAVLVVFFTNRSSGYLERLFERLF